jgi:hypothetical protein
MTIGSSADLVLYYFQSLIAIGGNKGWARSIGTSKAVKKYLQHLRHDGHASSQDSIMSAVYHLAFAYSK